MEADLARYYDADLRDWWCRDTDGRRRLTLRMIAVRVRYLPTDCAVARVENDGVPPWSRTDHLLDDLRMTLEAVGGVRKPRPHPKRPRGRRATPSAERVRKLAAARARARDRRRAIEEGRIT